MCFIYNCLIVRPNNRVRYGWVRSSGRGRGTMQRLEGCGYGGEGSQRAVSEPFLSVHEGMKGWEAAVGTPSTTTTLRPPR